MNAKLTTIDKRPETTTNKPEAEPTPTARPPIRRQIDRGLVTGPGSSYLLSTESPEALQTLRLDAQHQLGARSEIQLVVAEFTTATAWHGLRALKLHGASIDTEVQEQAASVNRDYSEIDPFCRTALIYHDVGLARVLRGFERTFHECHRSLRRAVPLTAGRTRN
ncbi:MAG: hypothetical protein IPP47_09780 [Bryobacterales bacterium]|nr:hypothetical protein [Bryobacterales bacterium]